MGYCMVMDWPVAAQLVAVVLLAVLLLLAAVLLFRRRALANRIGAFECFAELENGATRRWVWGIGLYGESAFLWYPLFSLSWSPRLLMPRRGLSCAERRHAGVGEFPELGAGGQVVRLVQEPDGESWNLGLTQASTTGMLSWLEAAPPGFQHPGGAPGRDRV